MDILLDNTNKAIASSTASLTAGEGETVLKDFTGEWKLNWTYDSSTKKFSKGNDEKFKEVRSKRDKLLNECDYTQLDDSTYAGTKDEWKTYRQTLRDITKGVTDPDTIVFPEEPK
tara:strand:+ start:358 stop:702 length:345 start_codon:yes stop_codon:yes gene_type:complete